MNPKPKIYIILYKYQSTLLIRTSFQTMGYLLLQKTNFYYQNKNRFALFRLL